MKKFFSGKRLYIILAAALILGIAVAVKSCSSRKKPDLVVSYIGENYFSSEQFYENISVLADEIDDINDDGKKEIEFSNISFGSNLTASQEQNNLTKLTMSMGQGESRIYLMDKAYCMRYADNEILADLTDYAPDGAKVLTDNSGKIYGICVEGSQLVQSLGLDDTEEVYVSLRAITEMDYVNFKDPSPEEIDKTARTVLELLIKSI